MRCRCEIDSGEAVLLKFSTKSSTKHMFEMLPGYHTQNFVAELYRLQESTTSAGKSDFSWTHKYLKAAQGELMFAKDIVQQRAFVPLFTQICQNTR